MNPELSLYLIAFPIIAGVVCLLIPAWLTILRAPIATAAGIVTAIGAAMLFLDVGQLPLGKRLVVDDLGLLSLSHMGAFMLLAVCCFGVLVLLYSMGYMRGKERLREYYAWILWTVGVSCGVILADDLRLLLVFWGLLGVALYVLVGIGGASASAAAKKSFVIVGGSDCAMLLGVAVLWVLCGTTSISAIESSPVQFAGALAYVAFACFAVASFAKAGVMPFHSWLPDCGEKAPASVTAFLPASLDKLLGIYLMVKLVGMFHMTTAVNGVLMLFGAVTVICAVMMALVQHDLKRLLSYHAVSQVGYMILGIGSGTVIGLVGGLFHMLNHAIYKSCLFLCAGSVEQKAGTTDLDKLGGLAKAMPLTFVSCMIAAMSISGIPPLNGFASKWMVYQGIIESGSGGGLWVIWLAVAVCGSTLTVASFVKVLHAVFLCKPSNEIRGRKIQEVGFAMWLPMVTLAVLCVVFGVFVYRLPLANAILPALGIAKLDYPGVWSAGPATILLLAGFIVGVLVYFVTTTRKVRETRTYIGGEILEEGSGSDRATSQSKAMADVEVSGVDFYRAMEEMFPLRILYKAAARKWFDIYDVGSRSVFIVVEHLRAAHSGRLPIYLTWMLFGLLVLLWALITGGTLL